MGWEGIRGELSVDVDGYGCEYGYGDGEGMRVGGRGGDMGYDIQVGKGK
jgi:hypothetical protein